MRCSLALDRSSRLDCDAGKWAVKNSRDLGGVAITGKAFRFLDLTG